MTSRMKPGAALAAMRDQNLMAAEIIAANPARYPGLMQEWAQATLAGESRRANHMSMSYLQYGVDSRGADAPMQPLRPQVAQAQSGRAAAVSEVPQRVVEQRAHAQDRKGAAGEAAGVARGPLEAA
jgi:hypothetical protein